MTEALHEPSDPDINPSSAVVDYFMGAQRDNPNFLSELANRLYEEWQALKPAEQRVLGLAERHYFPEDLLAREKSTKAYLLSQYINGEIAATSELEQHLNES